MKNKDLLPISRLWVGSGLKCGWTAREPIYLQNKLTAVVKDESVLELLEFCLIEEAEFDMSTDADDTQRATIEAYVREGSALEYVRTMLRSQSPLIFVAQNYLGSRLLIGDGERPLCDVEINESVGAFARREPSIKLSVSFERDGAAVRIIL